MFDDTYWADLRYSGEKEYLHSNKHFFRNIIFFSNYFGSYHMLKDDKFVINVSRDKEIEEVINSIDSLSELRELPIQSKYHNYRNEKLLDYTIVGEPIIKNKLQELYYKKYPEELPRHDEEVAFYKSQIQRLNSQISIRKNIDTKDLEQLENALIKLSNTIRKIKGDDL